MLKRFRTPTALDRTIWIIRCGWRTLPRTMLWGEGWNSSQGVKRVLFRSHRNGHHVWLFTPIVVSMASKRANGDVVVIGHGPVGSTLWSSLDEWFDDLAKYGYRYDRCWNTLGYRDVVPQHGRCNPFNIKRERGRSYIWSFMPICSYSYLTRKCHFFSPVWGEHVGRCWQDTQVIIKIEYAVRKRGRVACPSIVFQMSENARRRWECKTIEKL